MDVLGIVLSFALAYSLEEVENARGVDVRSFLDEAIVLWDGRLLKQENMVGSWCPMAAEFDGCSADCDTQALPVQGPYLRRDCSGVITVMVTAA
jgi:hypothetical protein